MPNAPVSEDVDLRRLAHAQSIGWTFKVFRGGLSIKGPQSSTIFYGAKILTDTLLKLAMVPRHPEYQPSHEEAALLRILADGPMPFRQIVLRLHPEAREDQCGTGCRLSVATFETLRVMTADGWLQQRFEKPEFHFEITEAGRVVLARQGSEEAVKP